MKTLILVLSIAVAFCGGLPSKNKSKLEQIYAALGPNYDIKADNGDALLTVPEIIVKYGYPVEIHEIETADGYLLESHRIPYGLKCGPAEGKKVIWLQHGLISDSSNWVLNGVEKALAYNLADACYDVWMGNARGNTYSRKHKVHDPDKNKDLFWSFSFDEMGKYDLPASIDYVLNATGVESIYYVGHSMGTTQFLVLTSEYPEYNDKIRLASLWAPVGYSEHMASPIALIAPFATQIEWLLEMFGMYEFLPTDPFMDFLGATLCHQNSPIQAVCSNVLFLVCGWDVSQFDPALLPTIMGHTPAGGSSRSTVHLAQGVPTGAFRMYDYGTKAKNQEVYGQDLPPDYDVSKVTAPVALYWGPNDLLSQQADIYRLAFELPNLVKMHRVNLDKFNHLDFLFAIDAVPLINEPFMKFLENF